MISDNFAKQLTKVASKAFSKMYDPSKITIQRIFCNHWDELLCDPEVIHRGLRPVVIQEVEKMMACGTIESGYEIYECPHCLKTHIICYTCKSRFCNSCGTKAAKQRADYISKNTLDVRHRHIVFTIDDSLRDYFLRDRELLNILFDAAKETLFILLIR
ncbi:MAG: transposase zinc-binding domain-containing protein [[Clostridium] innocuum]